MTLVLSTINLLALVQTPPAEEKAKPAAPAASADAQGKPLQLDGITFMVPQHWKAQEVPAAPMAPKAVFEIPAQSAGQDSGMVRITHYPEMKGKDEMNIDRWVGQAAKDDGKPATRADAKIEKAETGNIRITTVDVSGNVKMTMRDTSKPKHRMIAAIVDHPKGPHFIVTVGPQDAMKTWEKEILGFFKSAKVTDK